jgi:hypothetical protein
MSAAVAILAGGGGPAWARDRGRPRRRRPDRRGGRPDRARAERPAPGTSGARWPTPPTPPRRRLTGRIAGEAGPPDVLFSSGIMIAAEVVAEGQLVLGAEQVVLAVPPGRGFPRLAVTFAGLVTIGRRIADPASGDPPTAARPGGRRKAPSPGERPSARNLVPAERRGLGALKSQEGFGRRSQSLAPPVPTRTLSPATVPVHIIHNCRAAFSNRTVLPLPTVP